MKNLKNYAAVRTSLDRLVAQLRDEARIDPRFKRGLGRVNRLVSLLKVAEGKYEIVHSRRVPTKIAKKIAKSKKKSGGTGTAAKKESATVTRLRAVS